MYSNYIGSCSYGISQIEKFIAKEHKVKVSLRLTGRERLHAESAIKVLDEFASHFEETATVEKKYLLCYNSIVN